MLVHVPTEPYLTTVERGENKEFTTSEGGRGGKGGREEGEEKGGRERKENQLVKIRGYCEKALSG